MSEGQNQQSRVEKATEFQGGTVHLNDSTNAIGDDATTISSNASETTVDGDWSISSDNTAGTTTLENTGTIDFGQVSGFTIEQVVVESPSTAGNFLIDDNPTGDTDLSGDGTLTFEPGDLSYTLGGE